MIELPVKAVGLSGLEYTLSVRSLSSSPSARFSRYLLISATLLADNQTLIIFTVSRSCHFGFFALHSVSMS